jgi:hypothetical protein
MDEVRQLKSLVAQDDATRRRWCRATRSIRYAVSTLESRGPASVSAPATQAVKRGPGGC